MLNIFMFYVMPLLNHALPLAVGGGLAFIGWRFLKKTRRRSPLDRAAMGDGMLVATAIGEVGNDGPKETYLKVTVLMELERLTEVYLKADRLRVFLGSIYLIAGFFSIAITGTDASIPGFANTVKFSFGVNIIGEVASGFLIFGGFEAKATAAYQLASLIRVELSQFIAQSAEYFEQSETERWRLFTHSTEALLLGSIIPAPQGVEQDREEEGEN